MARLVALGMHKSIAKDKSMVDVKNEYEPDSVSPPWGTILDTLADKGIAIHELARAMDVEDVTGLLSGEVPIDEVWAERLERSLDIPASFWLNRQKRYDESKGMAEKVLITEEETEKEIRAFCITGSTDEETVVNVFKWLVQMAEHGKDKPAALYISSMGGTGEDAMAIYDLICNSGMEVDTHAIGACYSAALIIFLAGKKRYAYPRTDFLYHATGGSVNRNTSAADIQAYADSVQRMDKRFRELMKKKTKMPKKVIAKAAIQDVFFDAKQALKWGVCDEILGEE